MTPEEKLILLCARQTFQSEHASQVMEICESTRINWERLFCISFSNSVNSIVYFNLTRLSSDCLQIPDRVHNLFSVTHTSNLNQKLTKRQHALEIVDTCKKAGYEVMAVKGLAHDLTIYEQPWMVYSSDVDLIVRAELASLNQDLRQHLYEVSRRSGIKLDYMQHHDVSMNSTIPIDWKIVWSQSYKIEIEGRELSLMCPEDMLITACISVCRKRFNLKQLCDVAEIIGRTNGLDWERIVAKTSSYKCSSMVYLGLVAATQFLGTAIPVNILGKLDISVWRRMVLEKVMRRGWVNPFSNRCLFHIMNRPIDIKLFVVYLGCDWMTVFEGIRNAYDEYSYLLNK